MKFSVLINPGFDLAKLDEVGYISVVDYILGLNKWDNTRIGWAGLAENGSTIGNVSGKGRCQINPEGCGLVFTEHLQYF